jgi:hypothetical protein
MRTIAVLILLSAASWQASAQAQPDAEAALLDYAEATKSYNTQQMSGFMHPEALMRVRATVDAALRGSKKDVAATELLPLFSVTSVEDFAQLSDVEVYKRLNDTVAKSAPMLVAAMSSAAFETVGSFLKDDLAYVTYNLKLTVDGKAINTQVVQTLKMHDGKWLLMLPSTAEASIAGIEARFQ